jgi:hypothetical protein
VCPGREKVLFFIFEVISLRLTRKHGWWRNFAQNSSFHTQLIVHLLPKCRSVIQTIIECKVPHWLLATATNFCFLVFTRSGRVFWCALVAAIGGTFSPLPGIWTNESKNRFSQHPSPEYWKPKNFSVSGKKLGLLEARCSIFIIHPPRCCKSFEHADENPNPAGGRGEREERVFFNAGRRNYETHGFAFKLQSCFFSGQLKPLVMRYLLEKQPSSMNCDSRIS